MQNQIPKNWQTIKLKDYTSKIGSGATPRGGEKVYLKAGISLIRSQNVYNNHFDKQGLTFITQKHADELKNVEVHPGDILLNITGDSVARSCEVDKSILPARVNQHVTIIRSSEKLNNKFLKYYLVSPFMQSMMLAQASTGGTRNALTKDMIGNFEIPYPPLDYQGKIVEILQSLDYKIELNNKIDKTLEDMAQSIFKEWFVDFRFPGYEKVEFVDSELGKVPNGWEIKNIGSVSTNFDRKRKPLSSMDRVNIKGNFPYYGAAEIVDYINEYIFDGEYLLIAEDGTVETHSGKPVLQFIETKFWANNHTHIIQGTSRCPTFYIYLALKNTYISPYITGAVQLKLTQENLNKIPILSATEEIVLLFTNLVYPCIKKIRNLQNENLNLIALRDLLLPKLMRGEIRV